MNPYFVKHAIVIKQSDETSIDFRIGSNWLVDQYEMRRETSKIGHKLIFNLLFGALMTCSLSVNPAVNTRQVKQVQLLIWWSCLVLTWIYDCKLILSLV